MYFSQCKEDKFLNENFFKGKTNGIYIELGAVDGVFQSNTKFFEDSLNWSGILIEPEKEKFTQLQKNRSKNYLFNELISCDSNELLFRCIKGIEAVAGVQNTLSQHHMDTYYDCEKFKTLSQYTVSIKPKTLTDIIKSTGITHVDFLSLDVEGHELEVLKSWDFSIPIDLILIETLGVDVEK
jgi:FkbM family methyltransferase